MHSAGILDRFRTLISPAGLLAAVGLALLLGQVGCADDADKVASFMKSGEEYVAKGQFDEAVIEFKNVLQLDPAHPGAHEALTPAHLETKKPRAAY